MPPFFIVGAELISLKNGGWILVFYGSLIDSNLLINRIGFELYRHI